MGLSLSMAQQTCAICLNTKTSLTCDACADPTCKYCSYFVDETVFEYIDLLPESLRHKKFCQNCYNSQFQTQVEKYLALLKQAKMVTVFTKDQSAECKWMKRLEKPISIVNCDDREETLLRMAFLAVEKGFNTLVDVEIKYTKVGENSYKKYLWSGTGVPVNPPPKK